ncbi:MAG: hypothetical protein PHD21_01090 [Flavobacteriales bacterium]|nr:hypothetical protein [Flavobacteriales bacterium]
MKHFSDLKKVKDTLEDKKNALADTLIYIPSLWVNPEKTTEDINVPAGKFYAHVVSSILKKADKNTNYSQSISQSEGKKSQWTQRAVIYNAFVRLTTAYDHDGNHLIGSEQIDLTINGKGIRDCGTFLKMIAILPYIKSLGVNTLYMLPVNKIGKDHRSGNLGSPYATADLFAFDKRLSDPLLPSMSVDEQFSALVQAAHILGIRVVMEFALRTAALDCTEVEKHPEWFYWIHKDRLSSFGSPAFAAEELEEIKKVPIGSGEYIAPNTEYRNAFTDVPKASSIKKKGDKYTATVSGEEVVIPGAFADWPPDDVQPAWRDVTYLRMYDFPKNKKTDNDYNYIAYNTIRYYDPLLSKDKYAVGSLWDYLIGVIPFYQKKYGIDGAMIDMGHAIPKKLIKKIIESARKIDPAFAFFEENFYPTQQSKKTGYNASLGFGWELTNDTLGRVLHYCEQKESVSMFGTLETHNTPRAATRGGAEFSRMGYAFMAFLPNVIPFIHSGFELLETMPVNTGVGFNAEQSIFYRALALPLFNVGAYNWLPEENIIGLIARINALRKENEKLITSTSTDSIATLHVEDSCGCVIGYVRKDPENPKKQIVVIVNTDLTASHKFYANVPYSGDSAVNDLLTDFTHTFTSDWFSYEMKPGQVIILKF